MFLTETQEQVKEMTRSFVDEVIRPVAEALDREERFPSEIYDRMAELGLFGIAVPEEMGGPGFDALTYAVVMEELSRGYSSVADQCGLVELISTLLVRHGTEMQRAMLPEILAMKRKVAYCITEPEAGTDVSGIRTTAEKDGDGWVLNGSKIWIHNAPVADTGLFWHVLTGKPATAECQFLSWICMIPALNAAPRSTRWGNAPARWEDLISVTCASVRMRCSAT